MSIVKNISMRAISKENRTMKIGWAARTLLGTAAIFLLLMTAGCNGAVSNSNSAGPLDGEPSASVQGPGDWGASLLAGGRVGIGQYPAKFTFDVTAAPSCANDFVVFNTSLLGASPTTAASQTATFTATAGIPSGIFRITNGATRLTLTASSISNAGTNFLVVDNSAGGNATNAASLAAKIVALGNPVNVTATSSGAIVTITALAKGVGGNSIGLTTTINVALLTLGGGALTGGAGSGNLVAFNQLYSKQGSIGGLCNLNGPSVYWSYFTGAGTAVTSVVLSRDGSKVAFVGNVGGRANLRILKWKSGQGTGAGYPAAVDQNISGANWSTCTAGNSCIASIAFSGAAATDTRSAPFYDYNHDVMYAGDDIGRMHKFTGVFLGTPTEVIAGWPITVDAGNILTGPVYDGISGNIFVGDSTGRLSFIQEVGSTVGGATPCSPFPCLNTVHLSVGTAGAIVDTPVVDGTTGKVFAVNGTETANNGTILQASTGLTGAVSFSIGGTAAGSAIYSGAFDNTYFTSPSNNIQGHMYVCGKDPGLNDGPAIYQLSFAPATGVLASVGATPLVSLVQASGEACSPVTEFDNPNGGGTGIESDLIFFSFGNQANSGGPIPVGNSCYNNNLGCIVSIDVTGNPTWPPAAITNAFTLPGNAAGATSGIVVDNTSTSAQASSIYFSLGGNSTGAGPGLPSCNTTPGVGCAVKLTQSGLN